MRDEAKPKPIFINDSLPLQEKENHISLIREYIDVFAWIYKDMSGLDPQIAMHVSISGRMPNYLNKRRFCPQIIEAIEAEVKKLIDSGFIRGITPKLGGEYYFGPEEERKDPYLHRFQRFQCRVSEGQVSIIHH